MMPACLIVYQGVLPVYLILTDLHVKNDKLQDHKQGEMIEPKKGMKEKVQIHQMETIKM